MKTTTFKNSRNTKTYFTIVALLFMVSIGSAFCGPVDDADIISLNPAYKLKRMSNGEVIIYSSNEVNGNNNLSFENFYADLLLAAYRNQRMGSIVKTFSEKYFLSDDECRREVKHALNVLSEWDIIRVKK
jgi:hypothetical protein